MSRSRDDRKPKSPAERARESRQRRAKAGEPLPATFDQVFRDTSLREYQSGNFNVNLNDLIASTVDELVTNHRCTPTGCRKVRLSAQPARPDDVWDASSADVRAVAPRQGPGSRRPCRISLAIAGVHFHAHAVAALTLAAAGRLEKARAAARRVAELRPDYSFELFKEALPMLDDLTDIYRSAAKLLDIPS